MKLEFKGIKNPLTHQGVRALVIVLGVIVVISLVVYGVNLTRNGEPAVLPGSTQIEKTPTPEETKKIPTEIPTITPLTKETPSASPSPTRKVQWPTWTPAPAVKEVTIWPTPTI